MSVTREYEALWRWTLGESQSAQVIRFAVTGGISTLIYAVVTLAFAAAGMRVTLASLAGYGAGAVFSYTGHRAFTFMSDGAIGFEIARFAAATAAGLSLSTLLAILLGDMIGLPPAVPVGLATVLVPVVNFIMFSKYVFRARRSGV